MGDEVAGTATGPGMVPLNVDGYVIYLAGSELSPGMSSDEAEVAARPADLDEALSALAAFATKVGDHLKLAEVSRMAVEFSCEFAVESGKFVAIVGKASTKAGVKVSLEWDRTQP